MIPLSAKELSKLPPSRKLGNAIRPTTRDVKKRLSAFDADGHDIHIFRAGLELDIEPSLRPLREVALEIILEPSVERLANASLDELAFAELMFGRNGRIRSLVRSIVVARGVVDAVEVKARSLQYTLRAEPNWSVAVLVVKAAPTAPFFERWDDLRHAVCSAPAADYASACTHAEAFIESDADDVLKATLAYAFPDETWGGDLLAANIGATMRGRYIGTPARVPNLGALVSTCRRVDQFAPLLPQPGGAFAISQAALYLSQNLPPNELLPVLRDALPILLERKKHQTFHKTPPRDVLRAIFALPLDDETAEIALRYLGDRTLGALAASYFEQTPDQCHRLESGSAAAKRLHTQLDVAGAPSAGDVLDANDERIPQLLRERAWRPARKAGPKAPTLELDIRYDGPERCTAPAASYDYPMLEGEALEEWRKDSMKGRGPADALYSYRESKYETVPLAEGLAAYNEGRGYLFCGEMRFVGVHGLAASPGFARVRRFAFLNYPESESWLDALETLETPQLAMTWARLLRLKKQHSRARRWLGDHAELAAAGLLPTLFAKNKSERSLAMDALDAMRRSGHGDAFREAAKAHDERVQTYVEELLARDLRVLPTKPPKFPEFLKPAQLPPLFLASGDAVPQDTRAALLELLSIAPTGYIAMDVVRSAFDEKSMRDFVRALVELWARHAGPARHAWLMRAALHLPDAANTARLCELARSFASRSKSPAASLCEVLAELAEGGEDGVLMHLGHIASTSRYKALREEVAERLQSIADERGLTRDELDDRAVPDLGLDAQGTLTLTFDERILAARCTESFELVLEEDGATLRSFPRGKSKERNEAKAQVDVLRKSLAALRDRQVARVERALIDQRPWSFDDARRFWFEHPLMGRIARALVWSDGDACAFRLCADGTFADEHDEPIEVEGAVHIAHPIELGESRQRWGELFADYEIAQPISQLGRDIYGSEDFERVCAAAESAERTGGQMKGLLEARGWRGEGGNYISSMRRDAGAGAAEIRFESGINLEFMASAASFGSVMLWDETSEPVDAETFEARVGAVALSEVLRDIAAIA